MEKKKRLTINIRRKGWKRSAGVHLFFISSPLDIHPISLPCYSNNEVFRHFIRRIVSEKAIKTGLTIWKNEQVLLMTCIEWNAAMQWFIFMIFTARCIIVIHLFSVHIQTLHLTKIWKKHDKIKNMNWIIF